MRGRMQAIVIAVVFIFLSLLLPPLNIISAAAVALVTLRQGQRDGIITILGAGIALGILGRILFDSAGLAIAYALVFWFPVWIFSVLLRESGQLALTFEVALGPALLGIIGTYLFNSNPASIWREKLRLVFSPMIKNPPPGIEIELVESGIQIGSHYMTGVVVAGLLVSLVLAILLGRWWQAMLFNPGGFRKEFLSLKPRAIVAYVFLIIFILAGLSSGLVSEGMINAGILGFFFYLIVGTAILHVLISTTSSSRFLLPVMYLVLLFIPYVLFPVAVLGFSDTWADWRGRIATK